MSVKDLYEGDDVIVRWPWEQLEMPDGYSIDSAAVCKCGVILHIKMPKIKTWHPIKCPRCGFIVNLFCGEEGEKLSMADIRAFM